MLRAAIGFFVLALVAYFFGISGVSGLSLEIGKLLLVVFLVLSFISFIGMVLTGQKNKDLP